MMKRLAFLFLLTFLLATTSCKKSEVAGNQNSVAEGANGGMEETSTTPPFPTKEPERYQATQIETISNGTQSINLQIFIARDGERRRVDEVTPSGGKISRLELPSGTYLLAPEKKIYTEENLKEGGGQQGAGVPSDFLPEKLLNEKRPEAHYEKLGMETVNGRVTMKYRVTLIRKTGAEKEVTAESLIWVDESLGMPIKSETTSRHDYFGISSGDRVTMELRDITETVDPSLFGLPPDYKKVEAEVFFKQLSKADSAEKGRD
jgi:outer membrane lipoprotein-sorting protein